MKKVAIILVNYKDYAKRFLVDCLRSIHDQKYVGNIKVFIVDNETSLETENFLKTKAPEAEFVFNQNNDGFAKGNNDAIKIAIEQGFDYVVCLNLDTVMDVFCVDRMVALFEEKKDQKLKDNTLKIGAVQALLMLHPETTKINSLGNYTHFLGFGGCDGYNQDFKQWKSEIRNKNIAYPSGAAVMFDVSILKEVGLFDEEMWMYNEDQDLGWRIWLAGYKCILASESIVYHKYEFSRSVKKMYWMDRNRIITIIKNYHWLTLLLIFPAFFLMEIGLVLFSFKSGWWHEKKMVWHYFLKKKTWSYLLNERKKIQQLRKVNDCEIIKMFPGVIWYQEIDDWKLRLINPVFDFYWRMVKFIIIW